MESFGDLYANHAFWAWVALGCGLLVIELLTGSGWLLWPAASAALTAITAGFAGLGPAVAVALFAVLTIATTYLGRRYLPWSLRPRERDINDNVARLLGHEGRAVSTFRERRGRVFIDGKEWAAELAEGESLEAGASVEVIGVHGARLKVRSA
jgi:membrane protein implicated in regulation of membrane protease activity